MFRVIYAMAENRKEVERELHHQTMPLIQHLFKLYLMPTSSTVNHWRSEVYSFINDVDRLKNTKKYPTAKQIYSWTYGKDQDRVTDSKYMLVTLRNVNSKYRTAFEFNNTEWLELLDKFDYCCAEYFSWLAQELSTVGQVSYDDVCDTLKEIFN